MTQQGPSTSAATSAAPSPRWAQSLSSTLRAVRRQRAHAAPNKRTSEKSDAAERRALAPLVACVRAMGKRPAPDERAAPLETLAFVFYGLLLAVLGAVDAIRARRASACPAEGVAVALRVIAAMRDASDAIHGASALPNVEKAILEVRPTAETAAQARAMDRAARELGAVDPPVSTWITILGNVGREPRALERRKANKPRRKPTGAPSQLRIELSAAALSEINKRAAALAVPPDVLARGHVLYLMGYHPGTGKRIPSNRLPDGSEDTHVHGALDIIERAAAEHHLNAAAEGVRHGR